MFRLLLRVLLTYMYLKGMQAGEGLATKAAGTPDPKNLCHFGQMTVHGVGYILTESGQYYLPPLLYPSWLQMTKGLLTGLDSMTALSLQPFNGICHT